MTNLDIVRQNVSICVRGADIDLKSLTEMGREKLGELIPQFTQKQPLTPSPAPTFRAKMAAAKAAKRAKESVVASVAAADAATAAVAAVTEKA